jgi:hypothetical protein
MGAVMSKEQLAETILNILEQQSFKNWLENDFEDYITGEENAPTKEQILKDLQWYLPSELR